MWSTTWPKEVHQLASDYQNQIHPGHHRIHGAVLNYYLQIDQHVQLHHHMQLCHLVHMAGDHKNWANTVQLVLECYQLGTSQGSIRFTTRVKSHDGEAEVEIVVEDSGIGITRDIQGYPEQFRTHSLPCRSVCDRFKIEYMSSSNGEEDTSSSSGEEVMSSSNGEEDMSSSNGEEDTPSSYGKEHTPTDTIIRIFSSRKRATALRNMIPKSLSVA